MESTGTRLARWRPPDRTDYVPLRAVLVAKWQPEPWELVEFDDTPTTVEKVPACPDWVTWRGKRLVRVMKPLAIKIEDDP